MCAGCAAQSPQPEPSGTPYGLATYARSAAAAAAVCRNAVCDVYRCCSKRVHASLCSGCRRLSLLLYVYLSVPAHAPYYNTLHRCPPPPVRDTHGRLHRGACLLAPRRWHVCIDDTGSDCIKIRSASLKQQRQCYVTPKANDRTHTLQRACTHFFDGIGGQGSVPGVAVQFGSGR